MNLSDVTIASSAWPMSSPPKRHYISFIWYVHVEFLLAKKILTKLLFIPAFMFIYSRVFGWYFYYFEFVLYTHVAKIHRALRRCRMYFTKYMYIDVFTILLLSNEYEGRVFTIYLWKSLFLPLFLRRKCREREKWFDHDPTHAGKDLYRSLKSTLVDTTLLIRRKYSNDMEHENTHW